MINKTPSNHDHFPVPVAGQEIPRGWFSRLVTFINSLVLHGDNQYLAVKHDMNGTTISPTTKLIEALNRAGTPPSAGGGTTYGMQTAISGSTASVQLVAGGTASSFSLIPGPNVTITGTTSSITISASGGGSSAMSVPKYRGGSWISFEANQELYFPDSAQVEWVYGTVYVSDWVQSNIDDQGTAKIHIYPTGAHTYGDGQTFDLIFYPSYAEDNRIYPYRATFMFAIPPTYAFLLDSNNYSSSPDIFTWEFMTSISPTIYNPS